MGASKTKASEKSNSLKLPKQCNIHVISDLTAQTISQVSTASGLGLDATDVEIADVTFVQYVLSARKFCESRSLSFQLDNPSQAAQAAFARAGVTAEQLSSIRGAQ